MTVCVVCVGDLPIAVDNSVPVSRAPKSESPPPLPPKTDDTEMLIPPDVPLTLDPPPVPRKLDMYVTSNVHYYAAVHAVYITQFKGHSSKCLGNPQDNIMTVHVMQATDTCQ